MNLVRRSLATAAPRASILVRCAVGLIFLTQGILKFTDPVWGVIRFTKIGFPVPDFTAHFVGAFEIVCGLLVTIGLLTRIAAIPLLIINLTAIGSTKVPELFRPGQGFWFVVSDGRTDFAMLTGILFLLAVGAGAWSLDARFLPSRRQNSLPPGGMEERRRSHEAETRSK